MCSHFFLHHRVTSATFVSAGYWKRKLSGLGVKQAHLPQYLSSHGDQKDEDRCPWAGEATPSVAYPHHVIVNTQRAGSGPFYSMPPPYVLPPSSFVAHSWERSLVGLFLGQEGIDWEVWERFCKGDGGRRSRRQTDMAKRS